MKTLSDFAKRPDVEFKHVDDENIKWRFHKEKGKHLALQRYDNHYKNWTYWEIYADTLLTDAYEEIKQPVTIKKWILAKVSFDGCSSIGVYDRKSDAEYDYTYYKDKGFRCMIVPFVCDFPGDVT